MFMTAQKCKSAKCLPVGEWIDKVCTVHMVEYHHKHEWHTGVCYKVEEPWKCAE